MMPIALIVVTMLCLATEAWGEDKPSPGPLSFRLTETAGVAGERLATVSFPFAEGEMPHTPPGPPFARGGS